ncbi:MAG: ImmA/IrrE family metallo-endopeptidase [Clostridia bacterium]|nr:ImmA/IrrE family metallo-endopeptidase [Clostridia bacterium]
MSSYDILKLSMEFRNEIGEDSSSPIDIMAIVSSMPELTLVFYPLGENISGMCVKGIDKNCIIAINSSMSLGRQRFTLAHEIFHYKYDKSSNLAICSKDFSKKDTVEKNADMFASFLLVPPFALQTQIKKLKNDTQSKLELSDIIALEQYFQVSRLSLLHCLVREKEITNDEIEQYNSHVAVNARSFGYSDDLYKPSPESKKYTTIGKYVNMAKQLLDSDKISTGKYEELLLTAFRSDIVYGLNEEGELFD